jgi:ATP-dependent Clp protease ATP-binding subunit ClpA
MFERFTNQSRRAVVLAQEEARMLNHNYIGTEHILLGLLHEGQGAAARALTAMDVTLGAAREQVVAIIGRGEVEPSGHIPFTPRAKKSLELSLREALQLGDGYIGTGHVLLGLIHEGSGVAVQMLGKLGADLKDLRVRVTRELKEHPEDGEGQTQAGPAMAEPERQQLRVIMRREVQGALDVIADRLSAIEQHLGITRPTSPALRGLDERIAQIRREKEKAIDVQDFGLATTLRTAEKQLIRERKRAEQETAEAAEPAEPGEAAEVAEAAGTAEGADAGDGAEIAAGADAEASAGGGESDEVSRLRARVADLEARLREHGIEPEEPGEPPAAAG